MPTIAGISWKPLMRLVEPNVKRGKAAGFSKPTVATSRPSISATRPFTGLPGDTKTAAVRPSSTSQKYSNELNSSAHAASDGAAATSTSVPNRPPITENTRPAPSTVSTCPLRVIM